MIDQWTVELKIMKWMIAALMFLQIITGAAALTTMWFMGDLMKEQKAFVEVGSQLIVRDKLVVEVKED